MLITAKLDNNSRQNNFIKMIDGENIFDVDEPHRAEDALNSKFKDKWKEAIASKLNFLVENETWSIKELLVDKKTLKKDGFLKLKGLREST